MPHSRRRFLGRSAAWTGGALIAPSLSGLIACGSPTRPGPSPTPGPERVGYGPLSPAGAELALPAGFNYVALSREDSLMSTGERVPGRHDGMAAFPLPNGNIRLIRNHEDVQGPLARGGFGNRSLAYDSRGAGGTTSLEVQVGTDGIPRLVRDYPSLCGTTVNCAGGATPWGSWLSCEETTAGFLRGYNRPHGYVYEVPVAATSEVAPAPLLAMGRFIHEAVAIDPATGIVYETEDSAPGGFYRFLPREPGRLALGGRLQMLAVTTRPNYNAARGQQVSQPLPVAWVDVDNPDPASAEANPGAVYLQGAARGGVAFTRLEGCFAADASVYFTSTNGGNAGLGQVWRYEPRGEVLTLVYESGADASLDGPDNITVSPRGGLVICEDGGGQQLVRGLSREGRIFDFALNIRDNGELAGATFSPDGRILFVNIQGLGPGRPPGSGALGVTLGIFGPWEQGAL